ncbi:hypothetical protein BpHYR1_028807 [Brachionus plicatilis]|uniref:Uncharacterized protein n=1 Tax=Brachionus plicatilis TaxID=10195 RepID=A0A3M7QCS3_BRAPC|nr:hypothetical protein BpHYR1_028807 [Brachionus plicatilis]
MSRKITINYSYNFTNLTLAKSSHTPILGSKTWKMNILFLTETSGHNNNKLPQTNCGTSRIVATKRIFVHQQVK